MGTVSQPTTSTVVDNAVTSRKLRIKILVKKPANGACDPPQTPEVNCLKKVPLPDVGINADISEKKHTPTFGTKHVMGVCQSRQVPKADSSLEKSTTRHDRILSNCSGNVKPIVGCKRRSEQVSEGCERKRRKMNRSMTINCQNILKKLMDNKMSKAFCTPVKPDLWGIDDYFDIIKNPMDLGTVKQKLRQNKYAEAEQFKADVKLTFSNAMLYNPPRNEYHEAAKYLNSIFDRLWGYDSVHTKTTDDVKDKYMENISAHWYQLPGKVQSHRESGSKDLTKQPFEGQDSDIKFPQKQNGSKGLRERPVEGQHNDLRLPQREDGFKDLRKHPVEGRHNDLKFPQKENGSEDLRKWRGEGKNYGLYLPQKEIGLTDLRKRPVEGQHHDLDLQPKENGFQDLKRQPVRGQHNDLKTTKDGEPKPRQKTGNSLSSKTQFDISGPTFQSSCPTRPVLMKCETAPKRTAHNDFDAVKVKSTTTLQSVTHDQVSAKTISLGSTVKSVDSVLDIELSPSRALRVAKLKDRFAGLIKKAQHHTLLEPGGGVDTEALQQQKEMLRTRQHEEKVKIEAQIRAIQLAAQTEAESELKKRRQAEREAARVALQEMEQSVFLDDNLQVLKDLEALVGRSLVVMCPDSRSRSNVWNAMKSDKLKSPLERLGLYIKEEYRVGDENDYAYPDDEALEEGEVVLMSC